jgi:hypothetical protein
VNFWSSVMFFLNQKRSCPSTTQCTSLLYISAVSAGIVSHCMMANSCNCQSSLCLCLLPMYPLLTCIRISREICRLVVLRWWFAPSPLRAYRRVNNHRMFAAALHQAGVPSTAIRHTVQYRIVQASGSTPASMEEYGTVTSRTYLRRVVTSRGRQTRQGASPGRCRSTYPGNSSLVYRGGTLARVKSTYERYLLAAPDPTPDCTGRGWVGSGHKEGVRYSSSSCSCTAVRTAV